MPEQADPPLFGKLVDFVCPSCVRHYVQLCFPFFSYFAEWKSFVISPGYHRDVTIWYHRDVTFWYHRDVTIWYQNVTSLWYLGDVTNWCHSDITNFSHSDISCDISVTSLWHQIVDWGNSWYSCLGTTTSSTPCAVLVMDPHKSWCRGRRNVSNSNGDMWFGLEYCLSKCDCDWLADWYRLNDNLWDLLHIRPVA